MKGKNEIRLSLTYNHFNKEHIFVSDETLISIDRMKINYCIYDLIDIFQNHDELYDSLPLLEYYLKEVKLLKEENLNAMYFIDCSTSSIKFTRRSQYLSNVKINLLFRWFTRNIQKVND